MDKPLELKDIGARLRKVDMLLMSLVKKRMELALEVERRKSISETPEEKKIFNPEREAERLTSVRDWAKKNGMNPYFAESLLYMLIGESCKQQMIQSQNRVGQHVTSFEDESAWVEMLNRNLLALTEVCADSYDDDYDKAFFATSSYLKFEDEILEQEIAKLPDRQSFLDLGCATGRLTFKFASKFKRTVGYDISPHMIEKAKLKVGVSEIKNISFQVADIQNGIPEADNSVSLAVMNLGTASDIRGLPKVLKEITRVLKPHGRFFLSFYNSEALLYRWDFIPWSTGLAAEINIHKHCLDVHFGSKILSVYARPYSVDEITDMIRGGLTVSGIQTYPTVSAILPSDLFENQPGVRDSITEIDKQLSVSTLNGGAYIVVTGQKTR